MCKKTMFKVTHSGNLIIGEKEINCAVLENGQRIITQSSIYETFSKNRRGSLKDDYAVLPSFLTAKNILPFITNEYKKTFEPVKHLSKNGREITGYRAETIPTICDIFIEAYNRGALTEYQQILYKQSLILVRALAKVGITALIDEATGFQNDRQAQELQNLLTKYIGEDLLKWQRRFPNQFYYEIFRIHGWDATQINKRPGYVGTFTQKYVYDLFPNKVMEIIKRENPKSAANNRLNRHHQYLSVDIGIPELDKHISKLLGVMALSDNVEQFEKNFSKAFAVELERKRIENEIEEEQRKIFLKF